jgi:hypothetical protein
VNKQFRATALVALISLAASGCMSRKFDMAFQAALSAGQPTGGAGGTTPVGGPPSGTPLRAPLLIGTPPVDKFAFDGQGNLLGDAFDFNAATVTFFASANGGKSWTETDQKSIPYSSANGIAGLVFGYVTDRFHNVYFDGEDGTGGFFFKLSAMPGPSPRITVSNLYAGTGYAYITQAGTFLLAGQNGTSEGVYRSQDGGSTFDFFVQPQRTYVQDGQGTLFSWYPAAGLIGQKSTDDGLTWTAVDNIPLEPGFTNSGSYASLVDSTNGIDLLYGQNYLDSTLLRRSENFFLRRSTDGGTTWVSHLIPLPSLGNLTNTFYQVDGFEADPKTGALYIFWEYDSYAPNASQSTFAHLLTVSNDHGITWQTVYDSNPKREPISAGIDGETGHMTLDPSTGTVIFRASAKLYSY